ncbi:ABC-type Fe3+-hydroxamate transport system, periplasmic component [Halovivax ruber XH-70]|uniref:ABC-type Fe3+-hydroxamate transport system, periplasmic component n=1 Tax=Halovivax ruber (strain DSM 18193 / JCM 13892 / XH-70) TaxID=797302 RepID=L0IBB9_HALRX|nr:ABC transporter substrate-binding protein [Halovivax ruber]AGB15541.1 ABC-type Fe3+-hydroxamate transport system, periplasmic component [Halovivax ruber XH-70]
MTDDSRMTRRTVLRTGVAAAGVSALAGCLSEFGDEGDEGDGSNGDETYTVSMPPVGAVEFDTVPESWAANNGSWADMGIALGQSPPEALYLASRYHTQYYDEIPGVSVDKGDMTSLWEGELTPEKFMGLAEDVDVFVNDPNFILGRTSGWEQSDIDLIEQTGTPFFANSIFSRGYDWHDYEYLSLYEAFENLAELFQETERYEAFAALHDEFQETLSEIVPPEGERPSVAIMWATEASLGEFSPYLIDEGTSFKQWRELGVVDAFAETDVRDFHNSRGAVGYETLLDIDPDVILFRGQEAKTAAEFQDTIVSALESDNTARKLSAVESGDVYRGGPLYQGPITNLVVTERAARQLYDVEEDLFDRQRVAEIVDGEL